MMESVAGRKLPALTRNVESSNLQDAAGAIAREDDGDDDNSTWEFAVILPGDEGKKRADECLMVREGKEVQSNNRG